MAEHGDSKGDMVVVAKQEQNAAAPAHQVSFFTMFRYSTYWERVLMVIGVITAALSGGGMNVWYIKILC